MPIQDIIIAGLKFDKNKMSEIGNDDAETTNALLIIIIAALISGALGGVGKSLSPGYGNQATNIPVAVVQNIVITLVMTLVFSWVFAAVARMFGADANTKQTLRIVGATQIWAILGYLILFAGINLYFLFGLIGFIAFLLGMAAATSQGVGKMFLSFIVSIIILMIVLAVTFMIFGIILAFMVLS